MRHRCGVLVSVLLLSLMLSCRADENGEHLWFTRLEMEGLRSDLVPGQELIICDQGSLDEFCGRYGLDADMDFDFDTYVIVGVFLGERPNPGHRVEISEVLRLKDSVEITYTEYLPDPALEYPAVLVYPYDMVYFASDNCEISFSSIRKQS